MTWFKCVIVVLTIWIHSALNWRSESPYDRERIYLIAKLKFFMNNKNFSGSSLSNKAILNPYLSNLSDVVFPHNLISTWYLSVFKSLLLLMKVIGGVSKCIYTEPKIHILTSCFCFVFIEDCFENSIYSKCWERENTIPVLSPLGKQGVPAFRTFTRPSWTSRIWEYVDTCARLPGHKFASMEGSCVAGRDCAYIPVIDTDIDARDRSRAGMARVYQGGLTHMFRHLRPI